MKTLPRFKFIGHALRGDGPFRPTVSYDGYGKPVSSSESYLIQYPRESEAKFAKRCELAFYTSPLARVTSRFISYISTKPVDRDIKNDLLVAVAEDADGKGSGIDTFWLDFMVEAKARGSMLLLVDMPQNMPENLGTQLSQRAAPYWTPINPELLTDYEVADDGKFDFAEFSGTYKNQEGETKPCTWRFTRLDWQCIDNEDKLVAGADHTLGECPILIFTESGDFPSYGPFAPVADMSKRLFNLDSELDEILRSQTFSLLTMQVPPDSSDEMRLQAAKVAGETIGASNLLMHSGSTPAFIAPADGPASIYLDRIRDIRNQINETGLEIASINQQESGVAMQMRFQAINAELAKFSQRMESMEQRAWELTAKWLGMTEEPLISWPRDFNIADTEKELEILRSMQETAMSPDVIVEQQKRVVMVQFNGMDQEEQDQLASSLDADKSAL